MTLISYYPYLRVISTSPYSPTGDTSEADTEGAPDYSQTSCWYQIPEITKEVDTFFVYPKEYLASDEKKER